MKKWMGLLAASILFGAFAVGCKKDEAQGDTNATGGTPETTTAGAPSTGGETKMGETAGAPSTGGETKMGETAGAPSTGGETKMGETAGAGTAGADKAGTAGGTATPPPATTSN